MYPSPFNISFNSVGDGWFDMKFWLAPIQFPHIPGLPTGSWEIHYFHCTNSSTLPIWLKWNQQQTWGGVNPTANLSESCAPLRSCSSSISSHKGDHHGMYLPLVAASRYRLFRTIPNQLSEPRHVVLRGWNEPNSFSSVCSDEFSIDFTEILLGMREGSSHWDGSTHSFRHYHQSPLASREITESAPLGWYSGSAFSYTSQHLVLFGYERLNLVDSRVGMKFILHQRQALKHELIENKRERWKYVFIEN